jgi:hypothetical protein
MQDHPTIPQPANTCPKCGGTFIGDGLLSPRTCENAGTLPWDMEPDSKPICCDLQPDHITHCNMEPDCYLYL